MRPRPSREIAPGATLNTDEIEEAEALVGLVVACRKYAGELAISEVTLRTFNELQKLLDTGTRTLLDALRLASADDRAFRLSQVDAAVRFCAKVFGPEYAAAMARAAEGASHNPSKTAVNPAPAGERKAAASG
jgi:hypothetical protein